MKRKLPLILILLSLILLSCGGGNEGPGENQTTIHSEPKPKPKPESGPKEKPPLSPRKEFLLKLRRDDFPVEGYFGTLRKYRLCEGRYNRKSWFIFSVSTSSYQCDKTFTREIIDEDNIIYEDGTGSTLYLTREEVNERFIQMGERASHVEKLDEETFIIRRSNGVSSVFDFSIPAPFNPVAESRGSVSLSRSDSERYQYNYGLLIWPSFSHLYKGSHFHSYLSHWTWTSD